MAAFISTEGVVRTADEPGPGLPQASSPATRQAQATLISEDGAPSELIDFMEQIYGKSDAREVEQDSNQGSPRGLNVKARDKTRYASLAASVSAGGRATASAT